MSSSSLKPNRSFHFLIWDLSAVASLYSVMFPDGCSLRRCLQNREILGGGGCSTQGKWRLSDFLCYSILGWIPKGVSDPQGMGAPVTGTPVFCLFSPLQLGCKVRSFWIPHTGLRQTNLGAAACLEVVYGKPDGIPLLELALTGQWDWPIM